MVTVFAHCGERDRVRLQRFSAKDRRRSRVDTRWASETGPLAVMMFWSATVVGIEHLPLTIGPTARKSRVDVPVPLIPL